MAMKKIYSLLMIVLLLFSCKKSENSTETTKTVEDIESTTNLEDSLTIMPKETKMVKKSIAELKAELNAKGYQTFDYIDDSTHDTIIMQQYFIAFLKRGPVRNQNEEESERIQQEHLTHLGKMYELGYADISGPFGDDGDIRGITIYNVPTLKMADSLANSDPAVKAGRLKIEIHPWWAAKGFPLR